MSDVTEKDDRFELVTSFEVVVPEGYNHGTYLDSFRKEHGEEFCYFNDHIADGNYAKATTRLQPRRKLTVKFFQIKKGVAVSSEDCLAKIRRENGILIGAQGVSIVHEQNKDELPKERGYVSFDKKESLWEDADGRHRVPYVYAYSDGVFDFRLGRFESDWDDKYCLLCFCDLPASEAQTSDA